MPLLGGGSQIAEKRAGRFLNNIFTDHPGGSLIQDRANSGATQETVFPGHNVERCAIDPRSGRASWRRSPTRR